MHTAPFANRHTARRTRAILLGTSALLMFAAAAHAGDRLPTGGAVSSGTASITSGTDTTTIAQSSDRAIINWQGFSVGPNNSVVFNQPNAKSATLNRVTGSTGSEIAGSIKSNGAVYLINPNGIAITSTGAVQTGGGFIASTLGMSDADFNAGKLAFAGTGASAAVRNAGTITAGSGAYVALLGGSVSNSGLISVPLGKVGLGSGEQVGLDLNGDHFMQVGVATKALTGDAALIDMAGSISAAGGRVTLSAASVKDAVRNIVNLSGTISADSAIGSAGSIQLLGGAGGTVTASGTLTARATGSTGDGGTIETSGASVHFAGLKVDTSATRGVTGHWLVDPTDLTVDAPAAATISANLATSNVTLSTDGYGATSGPGTTSPGNGDITIASALAWASANMLSLSAYHNININAPVIASAGGLTLAANNSGYQPASVLGGTGNIAVGTFTLSTGNWVQNAGALPSFSATNFSFNPQNASFLRAKGGDGSTATPFLLTDIYGVQGMRAYGLLAQNFALANDIDASGTSGWNAGAGFAPIGDNGPFTGNFDGQNHTISGLTINVSTGSNIGLFAQDKGNIDNLTLSGSILGNYTTGSLVGYQSGGTITNVTSSATVSGAGNVGGLVGLADGNIVNSHASGAVNGTSDNVGGLVGILAYRNYTVSISGSSATGDVTDTSGRASSVGGLVGSSAGSIDRSFATGKVTGAAGVDSVGGLVGLLCSQINGCSATNAPIASITNSYATGDVSGGNGNIGGLVGQVYNANISGSYADGKVTSPTTAQYTGGLVGGTRGTNVFTNVYATGDVAGATNVGGLIGNASGVTLSQAHASGNVTANQDGNGGFGGLVGTLGSDSSVTQSYATGNVTHGFQSNAYGAAVGGLVGRADGSVTYAHASGAVSGTNDYVGGLIGFDNNQSGVVGTNNYATGNVTGNTTPDAYFNGAIIGGLIGYIAASETITASYATGNVSAVSHSGGQVAGGLIGYVGNVTLNLSKSFATGNVSVTGAVSTPDGYGVPVNSVHNDVGGLIGNVFAYKGLIDQVYASGNVASDGQSSEIGGLIGLAADHGNNAVISNAYATGSVTATGFDTRRNGTVNSRGQSTGGLIGELGNDYSVINTYATGKVTGANGIGGLLGYNGLDSACTGCGFGSSYWNTQTTGQATTQAGGTGLTSAQMQDITKFTTTYAAWDFGSVWAPPSAGNYPQLYALTPVVYATANSATTTYGTAPTSLGTFKGGPASYVFGPAGDTLAGFLAGATTATTSSNAGQYAVTPYAGGNGSFTSSGGVVYRVVADGSGTLTINPAVITVSPITAALTGATTKVYDGTTAALLVPSNFALSGFKNGDGASVNQTVGTFASANAGTGILVTAVLALGNYNANSGTTLSNYTLPTSASGSIGTITPAALTLLYTANPASRNYGDANPALTGAVSARGLVASDTLASVTSGTAAFTSGATTASNAGSYAVNGAGLSGTSSNYIVSATQAASNATALTVAPRPLTLAAAPTTRVYGAANPITDAASVAAGSLVNGDTLANVAVATPATAKSNVSKYDLLASNALFASGLSSNYAITYNNASGALTITPATLALTYAANAATSVYGNAVPTLSGTISAIGLVNGDTLAANTTGTASFASAAGATSNVGSYAVNGTGITAGSANYTLTTAQAAGNAAALSITPRPVTVTANGATNVYGAATPTLTYAIGSPAASIGLVNGDALIGALATTATSASGVGQYAITRGTLGNPNYSVNYNGASLTITPAALQVLYTAFATSNIYGNAIPALTGSASATGLVNDDTVSGVTTGTATFATTATAATGIGSYAILGSGLAAGSKNYTIGFAQAPGNATALTITPRPLTITADPEKRSILLNNPALTYQVGGLGLVNGDTLTGQLVTNAQVFSGIGVYPITVGTLAASKNYSLNFVGANLTVNPPPTQSLSAFLTWLRQVVLDFEQRERACSAGSVASSLRGKGSATLTGAACGH